MAQKTSAVVILFAAVCLKEIAPSPLKTKRDTLSTPVIQSCQSPVYCQGKLLDVVQMAGLMSDSKTFVDMSQINPQNVTLQNFWKLMNATNSTPSRDQIEEFVNNNFITANETTAWNPPDFTSNPAILNEISNPSVQQFARSLINIWPNLGRQLSPAVKQNPDRHSILDIPNPFIVPGGRFRELYYWDSYWIIKGLLISEMYQTVQGMLGNICHLINEYGFMPNGARLYYLNRSQPPLFALMIREYIKVTSDTEWISQNIQCVERELDWWLSNRIKTVEKYGVSYQLAHYGPTSNTPRPESYLQDVNTCKFFEDEIDKRICYQSLKTGAETGWDFSSRWFFDANGTSNTNLTEIRAQRVMPVDLNAFLCKAFESLSEFYGILGNTEKQAAWKQRADTFKKSIEDVFYDSEEGIWFDYDPVLQRSRKSFYPSNYAPLWAEVYNEDKKDEIGRRAADYFRRNGVDQYLGGIPTSLLQSGEQWDLRNAWPPLQEFVVLGLLNTGNSDALDLANILAQRWVEANMQGYSENGIMFEKYDAIDPGKFGGGGEYTVQEGFGWTNGVVLSFIYQFYANR